MWHKAIWKGHPMRLELIRVGLLVQLANHYTTRVYVCHFLGQMLACAYLFVWSNLKFLYISQWLATQSYLVVYSFCVNLLHLLMWLIVSSLSTYSLHFLFCWVLSILALICLVLMALFYAAIGRDSVSLLKFPFLREVQVFFVWDGLLKGLEDLEVGGRVETIQMTALLRTASILRRVLETWGDSLSLRFHWKTIG